MSPDPAHNAFFDEFTDFARFLQTLWGILSGISIFFPLSNALLKIIPMRNIYDDPPGGLAYLDPTLITTLSTIATLFVILVTFRQRHQLSTRKQQDSIQKQAWIAFGVGVIGLLLYLIVYFGIYTAVYDPFNIMGGDPRRLIGDFLLLLFYGVFFAMITRAFILLGMLEYFSRAE
jgi:hypothetical protein